MTIEEAIKHCEEVAKENYDSAKEFYRVSKLETHPDRKRAEYGYVKCKECADENRQLAEWLRELQERRKADSCEGCKNISLWENEYENGVSCPCLRCTRRAEDKYEPERKIDG